MSRDTQSSLSQEVASEEVMQLSDLAHAGLTQKQMAARRRLHQETALLAEHQRVRKQESIQTESEFVAGEVQSNSELPNLVFSPEDAPDGPPWRYEPTASERALRAHKKEQRALARMRFKTNAFKKTPQKLKNASDLQVRFRTGLIYTLLTIVCILIGDYATMAYFMIVAGICAGEFYYMLRSDAKLPNEAIGITGAVLYVPAVYFWGLTGIMVVAIGTLLALLVWYVFWLKARVQDVGVSMFGALYTGLLLCGFVVIRASVGGIWGGVALFVLFLSVWANDAFAYLFGSKFGKHKLAPRISPKKTWEGFSAGLVGSCVFWVVLTFVPGVTMDIWMAVLFGVICAAMEVFGDLAESRIKRNSGFKDSGTLMPGHGGLLDRCDSLFMASITSALLLLMGGCIPNVLL